MPATGSLRTRGAYGAARCCAGLDLAAVLQFVLAVNDNHIAGLNSGGDAYIVAGSLRRSDRPSLRHIARRDNVDVNALRPALNRGGWNYRHAALGLHQQVHVDELVGEQFISFVFEDGFELVSARRGINLVVNGEELARGNFGGVVVIESLGGKLDASAKLSVNIGQLIFRKAEQNGNGLKLRDKAQTVLIVGMNNIARVHQAQADASRDGRSDAAVAELELGVVNRRLVNLDGPFELTDRSLLRVRLLLGDNPCFVKRVETGRVRLGVVELGRVARELPLGLFELHLKRARVNLSQHVALVDNLPFRESNFNELAVNAAVNGDGVKCRDRPQPIQINRQIGACGRGYNHGHD